MHAELTLRDELMLSPKNGQHGNLSAKSIGDTPVTLYILVDVVDRWRAVAAGGPC